MGRPPAAGRRLRIAHLATVDMSLALLLATELATDVEHGFDVFAVSAPGPYVAHVEGLGIKHVPVVSLTRAWAPGRDLVAARELAGVLRRLDLDVLHTHTPKAGVLGRVLGRLLRVPVIVNTCHGLWATPDDTLGKRALVYGAEALAAWFSDAELYQNDADRRTLARLTRAGRARTVGNGIDLARFRFDAAGRARVRAELGVAAGEVLVGGVGRLVAEKGVAEFAACARALAGRARFVWAGPADGEPGGLPGLEASAELLGLRHDMPALYSALDVFVLPSHREGFSRSAMEAAACRCALVLSDIRGCREIGAGEREVLLVPPRDARVLTVAVGRLLDDSALRERLSTAAEARARSVFDQRRVARASIETYRVVAARKGLAW